MKRLAICIALLCALCIGLAHAQQVPGTLLDPSQVDPALTQALSDYIGTQTSYTYVGDCGLYAPDVGQLCSEVFLADDGSLSLVLLDAANAEQAILQPVQQSDGSWLIPPEGPATPTQPAQPGQVSPPAFAGPITVSATLSTGTCSGGTVRITALVTDANGSGVHNAAVAGHVQYRTTGHDFAFPGTDSTGHTSTSVDTGRPRGGYNAVFTVTANVGGYQATTTASCFAP